MKAVQLIKLSAVVLALGSVPMHTAFAHEGCESEASEQQGGEVRGESTQQGSDVEAAE